jgi:hypothetical protein
LVLQPGSALTAPTTLLKEKVQLNHSFNLWRFLDKYTKMPQYTEISLILIYILAPFKLQCSYQEKSEIRFNYVLTA